MKRVCNLTVFPGIVYSIKQAAVCYQQYAVGSIDFVTYVVCSKTTTGKVNVW